MSIEDLTGTIVRKICMACSREFPGSTGACPHDGNVLVPLPQDPYVGRRISDKYQVLSVLGTGAMGVVYLARHETMQSNVAIKMLRAQFASDQIGVKRFTQEAIASRRLNHQNVITTYDHGFTAQGQPYIVMEVLKGVSLADEIKKLKNIPIERVLHIFAQACDALDHAHKQGIIHRDLKPGNLMLINYNDDPDFVKVVDFGVAKVLPQNDEAAQTLTQTGEVCGSPVYMSPEQCLGSPLDRRADIYSMGVVIYEALVGKAPLLGKSMMETMGKHIKEAPPPFKTVRPDLYIPERLEQVVMRALSKQPENRQQSMANLKHELLMSVPRPGQSPNLRSINTNDLPPSEQQPKAAAWLVPAISAAVAVFVVAAAGFFFFQKSQTAPANQGRTLPAPGTAVTTTPVTTTTPANTNPVTITPANTTPVTIAPANTVPVETTPVNSTPTATSVAHTTPDEQPQVVLKKPPKTRPLEAKPPKAKTPKTKTSVPITAKTPKSDPFASLANERTYTKN